MGEKGQIMKGQSSLNVWRSGEGTAASDISTSLRVVFLFLFSSEHSRLSDNSPKVASRSLCLQVVLNAVSSQQGDISLGVDDRASPDLQVSKAVFAQKNKGKDSIV